MFAPVLHRRRFFLQLAAGFVALSAGAAHANGFPDRPIKIVVPFAPGAGTDAMGRLVAGKRTADLMKARCPTCIENFSERMGSDSVKGTESLVPERILKAQTGHLGVLQSDWVQWKFRLYKNLETEEALVLRNTDLKLWWVGSAVQNRDIPDLYDGDVVERINFLGRLKTRMSTDDTILTSFGALGRDWVERNLNYFVRVQQEVLYGLEEGVSEVELIEQISAKISSVFIPKMPPCSWL